MTYTKEIKVGLTLVISTVVLILGVRYFEDLPLFRGTYSLYTTFEDASGILPGNPVRINGVNVGTVDDVRLDPEAGGVLVQFHIDAGIAVPEGSYTEIGGIAALNSLYLAVHLGPPGNPRIEEGGYVPSLRAANILGQLTDRAPALMGSVDTLLISANRTLAHASALIEGSDQDVAQTLAAFRGTAVSLNELLRAEQQRIATILANAEAFSTELGTLSADLGVVSGELRVFAEEDSDTLRQAVRTLNRALLRLDRNLDRLELTVAQLDEILGKIDRGEGTLGLLVNDPSLYYRLDSTLTNLNTILTGFEENPGRYLRELQLIDIF